MSRIRIAILAVIIAAAGAVFAGCGSSGTKLTSGNKPKPSSTSVTQTSTQTTAATSIKYHPRIDPSKFTNHVTNKYFPMKPGKTLNYVGIRDGVPTHHTFTVTHQTKVVMGVRCAVIKDIVTQNHSLVEKTDDWYAQDSAGNVWYFGENTAEYQNGVVTNTAGTWEAGVDKAQPGIVMPAVPKVGRSYRQEFRPGVAMDIARITSLNGTARVPAGTFHKLVVTLDKNPLDPSKIEHKSYAAGIGFVFSDLKGAGHHEITRLAK